MREARQFDPGAFITTLADLIASGGRRDSKVVLGLDEGMNDKEHIPSLCRRLQAANLISWSVPLWYQQRVNAKGERFTVLGKFSFTIAAVAGRRTRGSRFLVAG